MNSKLEQKVKQMYFKEGATVNEVALSTGKTIIQITTIINNLLLLKKKGEA